MISFGVWAGTQSAFQQWLLLPSNNVLSSLITKAFQARGLDPPRECVSADVHTRLHLLATGRFLTFLPDSLLQFVAKRWSLKALPIDLSIQAPALGIITLRNRTLSPVVLRFIEAAREVAKSLAERKQGRKS
jgi:DNA-binding transcriptional LysR family regulator